MICERGLVKIVRKSRAFRWFASYIALWAPLVIYFYFDRTVICSVIAELSQDIQYHTFKLLVISYARFKQL